MTDFCYTQMNDKKTRRPVSDQETGRLFINFLETFRGSSLIFRIKVCNMGERFNKNPA